ncbi:MAG: carbon storage regulator [Clostridium sp.]|nr:carbon storage regulator [Clostridium sp.]
MLRLTVSTEEYLMIGDDIKLVFLGGTGKHLRIMVDAPKETNILRSSVLEKDIKDPERRANLPKYYAQVEHPEKYVKKTQQNRNKAGTAKPETITEQTARQTSSQTAKPRVIIARGNAGSNR